MSRIKIAFDALQASPDGLTCHELSQQTGLTRMQASAALSRLADYGKARRVMGGTMHRPTLYWTANKTQKQPEPCSAERAAVSQGLKV